ncbi:MAG TPA: DUF998 domain-containing protein [Nitrospiria bacterium]|nr:DUF998 domain-containing protein [Nitrospiria bacterium]
MRPGLDDVIASSAMALPRNTGNAQSLIISYLTLRKLVGLLGAGLPFIMALGGWLLFRTAIQPSISGYYYTGMRDVLVGILCAIGVFLVSYHGYNPADFIAGKLGGLFAFGIALFPTTPDADASPHDRLIGEAHLTCAALFFLTIACFSLFLFTKTDPDRTPTARKRQRNRIYLICGCVILACLALIAINLMQEGGAIIPEAVHPVFWLETAANLAFGISWIVKGEAILKDEEVKSEE